MKKKIGIGIGIYLIVVLLAISIMVVVMEDKEAPTIQIADNEITYKEGENLNVLLDGISAVDNRDGDVTASLTVESVHVLSSGDKVSVTYAARDSKNNVAKKERIVAYESVGKNNDSENNSLIDGVISAMTGATEKTSGVDHNVGSEIGNDENALSSNGEDTNQDSNNDSYNNLNGRSVIGDGDAGNDNGDINDNGRVGDGTEDDGEDMEPLVSTGDPVIRLTTKEVTIQAGGRFNPLNYVQDAVDDVDDAWRRIQIVGEYHTSRAGVYTLEYYVMDSDGNMSNVEMLRLVVK